MFSRSLFDDGHSAPNFAAGLEIAQQNDRVGQIGDIDRRLHVADQPMLGHRQEGSGASPVHVLDQFVDVQDERIFLRHRGLIAVQAVDHDRARSAASTRRRPVGKFAGGELGRVHLLDVEPAGSRTARGQGRALSCVRTARRLLVEHEHGRPVSSLAHSNNEVKRERAVPVPPKDESARPG